MTKIDSPTPPPPADHRRRWLLFPLALLLAAALGGGVTATALDGRSPDAAAPAAPSYRQARAPQAAPSPGVSRGRSLANELSEAFEYAAGEVSPAVVAIFAEQPGPQVSMLGFPDQGLGQFFGDDFFRRFFPAPPPGGQGPVIRSMGSGVIVSPDGLVLTNNHVVDGAQKLTVLLGDKRRLSAHVVGTDPPTDVAVVQIDGDDLGELPVARLGASDGLKVGEWVLAVGNPFQLLHTVTAGIVSARGRSSMGLADYEDFIQTDASINPGNSGGALADLDGNVVGINTAISTTSGGSVGIGFAIPIDMAREVMDDLVQSGEVSRGYLALLPQDVDDNLAAALDLPGTEGSLVADVTPGGPAAEAGIERGDVITRFDGQTVHDSRELRQRVAQADPGSRVEVSVLRDGREQELSVKLGERPKTAGGTLAHSGDRGEESTSKLGLQVEPLTPALAHRLGVEGASGVVVAAVVPGSPADDAGLQAGDLVVEADRKPVSRPEELAEAVGRHASGDSLALLVRRGNATFFAGLRLP